MGDSGIPLMSVLNTLLVLKADTDVGGQIFTSASDTNLGSVVRSDDKFEL